MLLTREELQERLVALHQASLDLVKDVSLETLLKKIATVACEQADARYAAVGVLDDEGKIKQFISVGMSEEEVARMPHPPQGHGLIGALMGAEEPIRLADLTRDPRSAGFPERHPKMRSFLGVPIRAAEIQLGQIYLTEKIGKTQFTQDDERIIQMLATYAAAAIQNARLYDRLKERDAVLARRNEDAALLNDIASMLASSLELDEILNRTLALVMNYMKVETGEIFLFEDDRQTLRMVLHRGQAAEAFWNQNHFKIGEGFPGLVAQTGEPIVSLELTKDIRFLRDAVVRAGFHQIACLPLKASNTLVGVLSVVTRGQSPFDARDVQMLSAVSNWAGLAIENARLHANARRLAVLEERERIGMDLHDGIIQSIYGVGLAIENIGHMVDEDPPLAKNRIKQVTDSLNKIIRDIRAYILDLRPRQMDQNDGLLAGIKRLAAEFRANTLAAITVSGSKADLDTLPQIHSLALFHICQEALANAAKHAAAKRVTISLWNDNDRVLMEVRDNGRGFDSSKMSKSIGHGLANMQTRARAVGGEVDISSAAQEGTTVLAWVPRTRG